MSASAPAGELKALLARADEFAGTGDVRAAVAFYQSALNSVRDPRLLDPQTLAQLQKAQAFVMDRSLPNSHKAGTMVCLHAKENLAR